ncbi:EF-hand domain-containing protein [Rhodoferax sp.]|uniref:EF-hand domain-containing protein n=1 Tax=Rhodoferax sp. TaxID=50421 RepID=UPI00283C8B3E|nr:EF-hand domain-containing protein [Rhodoferax sp.]MDR3368304.1 EF-hand domain-containing protein [Rhodoferax sp.]
MSLSISPVANGSGGGVDSSKMASTMASKMMSDLDPNNTGKVTKDQFISGLTAKGVSSDDAAKMYDAIDTKKAGSIGKSDIEAAIKNGNLKPQSINSQGGTGGAAKPGGADGAEKSGGAGGAGKSSSASSSSTTYAKADTNEDGVVSTQEAAVYAMKHPSVSTTDSTNTDPSKLGKNVDKLV